MNLITASNNGLIKSVSATEKKVIVQWGTVAPENEVDAMIWGRDVGGACHYEEVITAHRRGTICRYDTADGQRTGSISMAFGDTPEGQPIAPVCGLDIMPSGDIFTCLRSGAVSLRDFDEEEVPDAPLYEVGGVSRARLNHTGTSFTCGGDENPLKCIDIETGKKTWWMKNVPHDELDMRVPIHVRDIAYHPTEDSKMFTSTMHHSVRFYDTVAQTRPIFSLEVGEFPINHIVAPPTAGGNSFIVGDSVGNVTMIDVRKRLPYGKYKGNAGSIRCVAAHPTKPLLAVCGFDRYARVYDITSRKPLAQLYLKSRLNHVLFADDPPPIESEEEEEDSEADGGAGESEEEAEDSADELWETLHEQRGESSEEEEEEEEDDDEEEEHSDSEEDAGSTSSKKRSVLAVKRKRADRKASSASSKHTQDNGAGKSRRAAPRLAHSASKHTSLMPERKPRRGWRQPRQARR